MNPISARLVHRFPGRDIRLHLCLGQRPEGDFRHFMLRIGLLSPQDGETGIYLMATAREGGEHLPGRRLIRRLAQHSAIQCYHSICGEDDGVWPLLRLHSQSFPAGERLHQLSGGEGRVSGLIRS